MVNIGGPTQSRRRLMMAMTGSVLLCCNEVWAGALNFDCRLRILSSVQRTAAFRVTSAYRTVSMSAILVISGVIPIGLKANERKKMWETKNVNGETVNVDGARKITFQHWQEKWNTETSVRWATKLLPDITSWMERNFGEVFDTIFIWTRLFL